MKTIAGMLALLCAVTLLITVPGVFATWLYAGGSIDDIAAAIDLSIKEFEYAPEEIVPTGPEAPVGEDHLALIEMILWEASYGLNATKKPIMHQRLENPGDVLYCDEKVQGGNLKHLMIDGLSESERLYFVMQKVKDGEYNAYTMRYVDIRYKAIGTEIEVYKTVMIRDEKGVWDAVRSYKGFAKVNDPSIVSYGIDVTTFRH